MKKATNPPQNLGVYSLYSSALEVCTRGEEISAETLIEKADYFVATVVLLYYIFQISCPFPP